MSIVLIWGCTGIRNPAQAPEQVLVRLQQLFAPLFEAQPQWRLLGAGGGHVAVLELPSPGWSLPSLERTPEGWALAIEHPIDVAGLPRSPGQGFADGPLQRACRQLEANPATTLAALAPPFALAWSDADGSVLSIQNDALGMSQLFEAEAAGIWALTNRPMALRALGLALEPVPEEWALWSTLGWFPGASSGFRGVRHLPPGTRVALRATGVTRTRHDALAQWVAPVTLQLADALELARESMRHYLRSAAEHWCEPDVALTGGWDSRTVVAAMRGLGARPALSVRGLPERPDVRIAQALALRSGLPLRVRSDSGLPASGIDGLRRSQCLAMLWQSGQCAAHRATTFLSSGKALRARRPSVTGQHGEIGRRLRALFHDGAIDEQAAHGWSAGRLQQHLRATLIEDLPRALRTELRKSVIEQIDILIDDADQYRLEGLARLDFFNLHEFTRRKGGALHAWQPRVVVAPFLAPGLLRAVFSVRDGLPPGAIHRHVLALDAPDWGGMPFAHVETAHDAPAATTASLAEDWRRPWGRENYDRPAYWSTVGRPLLEDALARDGLWQSVFDPGAVRADWVASAERVAVMHALTLCRDLPPTA